MHLTQVPDITTSSPVQCMSCQFTVQLCFRRRLLSAQTGDGTDLHIERDGSMHESGLEEADVTIPLCWGSLWWYGLTDESQENCFEPYGAGINQGAGIGVRQQELASSPLAFAFFSICDATLCSDPAPSLTKQLCMRCWCSSTYPYTMLEIRLIPSALWSVSTANSIRS